MITKSTPRQEKSPKGDEIKSLHPLCGREWYMEVLSYSRQGQVDDGDIEGFEKYRRTGQPENDPLSGIEKGRATIWILHMEGILVSRLQSSGINALFYIKCYFMTFVI